MTNTPGLNPFGAFKKAFMHTNFLLTLALIALVFSNTSYAYEPYFIYEDGFDNGLEGYSVSGNVSQGDGTVTLRGGSESHITKEIDLSGYQRIFIEGQVTTYGLDYGEAYSASFSVDGVNFIELLSHREENGLHALFPSWLKDQTIWLRISLNASSYFERLTLDYFRVRGDKIWTIPESSIPPVSSTDTHGPYATTQFTAGPNNTTLITMPTNLGDNGLRHPIFVWGPATGQDPETDSPMLEHLASHGFVVLSEYSTGTGREMLDALTWLSSEAQTVDNLFYNKIDTQKVGLGGHSRGVRSALNAATDSFVLTTLFVSGASTFYSEDPESLYSPSLFLVGAEDGSLIQDMQDDFDDIQVPSVFTVVDAVDKNNINSVSIGMITAWLRWQVAGEYDRKDQFVGNDCEYCQAPYDSQSKLLN